MGRSGRESGRISARQGRRAEQQQPYPTAAADPEEAMDVEPVGPKRRMPRVRRAKSLPARDAMEQDDDTQLLTAVVVTETTRGQILQRHKKEYRQLRDQIAQLKETRRKLNKRDPGEALEKKEMGKQMKQLLEQQQRRHQRELAAFDAGRTRKQATAHVHLDLQSINLNFSSLTLK